MKPDTRTKDELFKVFIEIVEWLRNHPECDNMTDEEAKAAYDKDHEPATR